MNPSPKRRRTSTSSTSTTSTSTSEEIARNQFIKTVKQSIQTLTKDSNVSYDASVNLVLNEIIRKAVDVSGEGAVSEKRAMFSIEPTNSELTALQRKNNLTRADARKCLVICNVLRNIKNRKRLSNCSALDDLTNAMSVTFLGESQKCPRPSSLSPMTAVINSFEEAVHNHTHTTYPHKRLNKVTPSSVDTSNNNSKTSSSSKRVREDIFKEEE